MCTSESISVGMLTSSSAAAIVASSSVMGSPACGLRSVPPWHVLQSHASLPPVAAGRVTDGVLRPVGDACGSCSSTPARCSSRVGPSVGRGRCLARAARSRTSSAWRRSTRSPRRRTRPAGSSTRCPRRAGTGAFGGAPFGPASAPDPDLRFGSAVLPAGRSSRRGTSPCRSRPGTRRRSAASPGSCVHVRTAGLDVFACHLAAAPQDGLHRCDRCGRSTTTSARSAGRWTSCPASASAGTAMPPILCGDFNAEPDSDEIRFLCSLTALDGRTTFFQDAWRVAGDGPGHTQDWRTQPDRGVAQRAPQAHRLRVRRRPVPPRGRRGPGARGRARVRTSRSPACWPATTSASSSTSLWPGRPED